MQNDHNDYTAAAIQELVRFQGNLQSALSMILELLRSLPRQGDTESAKQQIEVVIRCVKELQDVANHINTTVKSLQGNLDSFTSNLDVRRLVEFQSNLEELCRYVKCLGHGHYSDQDLTVIGNWLEILQDTNTKLDTVHSHVNKFKKLDENIDGLIFFAKLGVKIKKYWPGILLAVGMMTVLSKYVSIDTLLKLLNFANGASKITVQ